MMAHVQPMSSDGGCREADILDLASHQGAGHRLLQRVDGRLCQNGGWFLSQQLSVALLVEPRETSGRANIRHARAPARKCREPPSG